MKNLNGAVSLLDRLHLVRRMKLYEAANKIGVYYGQMPVLSFVMENDSCTQKQIANDILVTPASIATSIKRMQKSGLITKRIDDENLRNNRISVTAKGRKLVYDWEKEMAKLDEKQFDGFTDEEIATYIKLTEKVLENLEKTAE